MLSFFNILSIWAIFHRITDHRIVWVGRNLWSSGPTPFLQPGQMQKVAQLHVQMTFEYVHGCRLHNFPGKPVTSLSHPHRRKSFLMFRWKLSGFSWCPMSLVQFTGHHWKPVHLQVFIYTRNFLFSRLYSPLWAFFSVWSYFKTFLFHT